MAHTKLQTTQEIYESIRSGLTGRITKLTNFTDRSFNYVWTQAFSEEVRELQELTLVSELAGFIDYTGGPITEDDIEDLEIGDQITAAQVNELMDESYLDEYVKIVGVTRNEGSIATGSVTFSTQSAETDIPEQTRVTTSTEADGTTTDFLTTKQVTSPDGQTSISDVPIESIGTGVEYNVPANSIIRINNPPVGVTGVTNTESTTGGEDREDNESLRNRAKSTVGGASKGGTVEGIKAYVRDEVDGVQQGDIIIDEFYNEQPPFVDVIVDGGLDNQVLDAIDFSRPAGMRHDLVRPQIIQIGANIDLLGTDIDILTVEDRIESFLLELGIGEEFYQDQFVREIMQSDDDIINIDYLDTTIERVTNEAFEYNTNVGIALANDNDIGLSDETVQANNVESDDMTLLPSSPEVGDAYYFGEETIFSELELNISTAGDGTWSIVWEYYDGANWIGLPNISDGTNGFRNANVNTVSWDIPSDWTSTVVDTGNNSGADGRYFVRARLDTFTSISAQPFGASVSISGRGHRLDYTVEEENGSITVEDKSEITYDLTDFTLIDKTGDGWSETLVWNGGKVPDESEDFYIDYDVTVANQTKDTDKYDANTVRDEAIKFNNNQRDTITYNNTSAVYDIKNIPFENSVTIEDENGTTFTEGTDWILTPTKDCKTVDTFEYSDTQAQYTLSEDVEVDFSAVHDENGNIYVRGTDYNLIDSDGDTYDDTIEWDTSNGSTPADTVSFTVTFNSYPFGVRWDTNNSTPPQDDDFTVTYDQVFYLTEYEIVETPKGIIRDASGNTYEEDVDYELQDIDRCGEPEGVYWLSDPSTLGNGEEFFVEYITEGDIYFDNREKADPGTINAELE